MSYIVNNGDTLGKIAQKFGTTYQELARINGISNPNLIKVGQVLKLPNSSYSSSYNSYTVANGDTLGKIAQKFGTTYQELARINGISNPNFIQIGQVLKIPNSNSYNSSSSSSISNSSLNSVNANPNPIIIKAKNLKVYDILRNSPWKSKADSLSLAYYTLLNNGYSMECAIGLMANLFAEGNYGIVEYSFSKNHSYGFNLPSGGFKCKTIRDIIYVRDWTTSNNG